MYGMSEYLMVMHEAQRARLLARRARKERSSPTESQLESHKSMSEGEKTICPGTKKDL